MIYKGQNSFFILKVPQLLTVVKNITSCEKYLVQISVISSGVLSFSRSTFIIFSSDFSPLVSADFFGSGRPKQSYLLEHNGKKENIR